MHPTIPMWVLQAGAKQRKPSPGYYTTRPGASSQSS
jgi:hypothetical protein